MTFQSSLVQKPHSFQLLKLSCVRRYWHPLAPTMVDSRRHQRPTQDSLRTEANTFPVFQPKKLSINSFPDTYQVDGRADYKSCIYQHRRSISIYRALAYSYRIHRDKYKTQHLSLDLESKRETNFYTNIERKYIAKLDFVVLM